jgi:hypothetical protein
MSNELGKIISGDMPDRDAVHIAIIPLVAGEDLYSGARVKLSSTSIDTAISSYYDTDAVGIVDPFLECGNVRKGEKFWCFLLPNTINGLRHHWAHPAFDRTVESMNEHKKWLLEFCDKWHFDCDELVEAATSDADWRYVVAHGRDLHDKSELDEGEYELFWYHMEGFTGQKFDEAHREGMGWSCSC